MKVLVFYLIAINFFGAYIMWADKQRAKKDVWRISEQTLFLVALMGGAIGITYGMYQFRHKTKHWYFKYGMPLIMLAECAALFYFLYKIA